MAKNTNLAGQPVFCQLLSFLPREIVDACGSEHASDRYYKTMATNFLDGDYSSDQEENSFR
jgi:hypothetical protein